ncbi:PilW family protein [Pseudoalteromonas xiamenensis]|uniref:PilW family protein n=1 Tax=Pseudoalteromonas xiamenensis TaxID=882626 RepID=UPI0035E8F6E8
MKGYTLIELLVAMVAGLILLSGVAMSYSAIKSTLSTTRDLEIAQEVVRYSNQVLTRSIKQTIREPQVFDEGTRLVLSQSGNTISCSGQVIANAYEETYTREGDFLVCNNGVGKVNLVKGLNTARFQYNNLLVSIFIRSANMPAPFANGVRIDIAASQLVLTNAYGSTP